MSMCSVGEKPQLWAHFDFWGLPYRRPFTYEGQIWCAIAYHGVRSLTCQISSRSVYSVALCWRKPPNFGRFVSISAFSGFASWRQSEKVELGCTATNLLLSNGIKVVSVLQRLRGEIGRTNSGVQKRDEQANRQTDRQSGRQNLNVFGRPGAGEIRAPPNLAW